MASDKIDASQKFLKWHRIKLMPLYSCKMVKKIINFNLIYLKILNKKLKYLG